MNEDDCPRTTTVTPWRSCDELRAGLITDPRTDLYSLGVILYELVTGKPPFQARSKAALLASILRDDPTPVAELVPDAPPALVHVIEKCLVKDPEQRWQSAAQIASELTQMTDSSERPGVRPAAFLPRESVGRSIWALTAALVGGLVLPS